jgi:hypothetical protein
VWGLVLVPISALAETAYITIPGEGWHLSIEAPALEHIEAKSRGRLPRHLVSTNTECREIYWSKAQANPMFIEGSESVSDSEVASFSSHRSEGKHKGKAFKTANAHAYIANNGICVDVHVSHWPYSAESDALVTEIIESVAVVK